MQSVNLKILLCAEVNSLIENVFINGDVDIFLLKILANRHNTAENRV